MIYSCTLYWTDSERMLLDLRLNEELGYVDKFIVAEATTTFRGNPREILLRDESLVDLRIADTSRIKGASEKMCLRRNKLQRNVCMPDALQDDDVLIFTDLDEIIHGNEIEHIVAQARAHGLVRLNMRMYRYWINYQRSIGWMRGFAASGAYFRTTRRTIDGIRNALHGKQIATKGQHFSWLGGREMRKRKLANHAHPANARKRRGLVLQQAGFKNEQLTYVPVDETYPESLLANLEEWKPYVYDLRNHDDSVPPPEVHPGGDPGPE